MTKIEHISCVIIAKNAQATISQTLDSLSAFSDVVVLSNNSTDETEKIVQEFENTNLIIEDFIGFGPTKNLAATYTKNEWILSLDADEILTQEFTQSLSTLHLNEKNVYSILRINFYKTTQIKHCWGNDILVRVYNKKITQFTDKKVHEKVIINDLDMQQIDGEIRHYPYSSITDFIIKLDRYSTIYAEDNVGKKSSSPLKAILNGLFSFFKTYFFKRGFLDGYAGLIIAFSHMATNFYKYIKLYEFNKELDI